MKGCENEGFFTHPMGACWTDREWAVFVGAFLGLLIARFLWRHFHKKT